MTRLIAVASIWAALGLAVYGVIAAAVGARRRDQKLLRTARFAAYANAGLLLTANIAMIFALVTHDFSISYVAQVGSRATPLFFTVISLWSALEGSILFWGLILAAYTGFAVYSTRRMGDLANYAMAVMMFVSGFFFLLLIGPANPFLAMSPVPLDGPGPNPLLQNHPLMAIHPPFLYLGYVGMTVPFAFGIGALLSGRLDDSWIRTTRRYTVGAWMFLTVAIVSGMWWSYEVLGWGGYWAWDPVENASFLPWLTATAFLHSVMVQERRGMLRVWNLSLIIATFLLTILGTFLTRSGVLSSVHAFSKGPIGMYFLIFIGVLLLFSLILLAGRSSELKESNGKLDDPMSRETAFLVNNLLLAAFCFTVLLGTLFPLVAEAVRGVKVSVGSPFFNKMTVPLCVALIFLLGVGPALPWRTSNRDQLKRDFLAPVLATLLMAIIAIVYGARSPYTVLAFGFGAFAFVSMIQQFARPANARRRNLGENAALALYRTVRSNPRRYGGYIAHFGVLAMVLGIAASSSFKTEREMTLKPGETMELGKYTLRFNELWGKEEPHRVVIGADLAILKNGKQVGVIDPRMNYYEGRGEPVPTPSVRSRATHDLYANLMAFQRDGSNATVHVWIQPFVAWIWIGGTIMALGALLALLPAMKRTARKFRPAELDEPIRTPTVEVLEEVTV
ncbi:MAG TPA: heme lyase CcmF/NrfE family subunit [Longimicrobiales bacterium]